jgi:YbbR domain-containing protein
VKFLTRLLFHNLLYKLVALLVAAVLWAAVQGAESVDESIDLPIVLVDVPESLVVVDQSATEVNVRVVGSRAAMRGAQRELTDYPISLEGLKPGEARFPVNTDRFHLPRGATITARSPSTIVLQTEPVIRKTVQVRPDVVGDLPPGYELLEVVVEPREVMLSGARSSLRRLREVLTDRVDVSGMRQTTTQEVPLAFGGSLVWRADDDQGPVKVEIRVRRPPDAPPPTSAEGEADRDLG